jgi:hypothetical protein
MSTPPPGAQVSPDGHYWWDGNLWQPVNDDGGGGSSAGGSAAGSGGDQGSSGAVPQDGSQHGADLGEYIDKLVGPLKLEAANAKDQGSILLATYDSSTHAELESFTHQCALLSEKAYTAYSLLIEAGVKEWVYSVKACHELGYWANSASAQAQAAAAAFGSAGEIHPYLSEAYNNLATGAASISGA